MTVQEIIQRSIDMHPSLLREVLFSVATLHSCASNIMLDKQAREAARKLANACSTAAKAIDNNNPLDIIMSDMYIWTSVLIEAARLQCLPKQTVTDAVNLWESEFKNGKTCKGEV